MIYGKIRIPVLDLENVLDIANKYKIYAYHAYFIATAKELNAPLFSLDKNLLQIARKEGLKVIKV